MRSMVIGVSESPYGGFYIDKYSQVCYTVFGGEQTMKNKGNKAFDHSHYELWIDPNEVTPYERNAKQHTDKQIKNICNSIKRFGWQQDTVITTDNVCVIGHGRRLAAIKLGCEMPYHLIDKTADELTDEDIRELRIADNQTNAETGFDFEVLASDIVGLDFEGFDFDFNISSSDEFDSSESVDDDFDVVLPPEPKTKLGDIWQLGRHRLICGDATNINDIEMLMDGGKADLFITDPPYNVSYEGATKDKLTIMNDTMEDASFREFLAEAFETAKQSMKAGASFYIWHADSEGYNFRSACHDVNWKVRQCLIWVKNQLVIGRQDYQWQHEPCLYGWNDGGSHAWYSDRKQTTILNFDKPSRNGEHPTMKPVPLFGYLIKNSSKKDDIILDTFAGSGTTIIACEQLGRSAYCSELDPKYCDVIIERYEKLTGEKAVLLNG